MVTFEDASNIVVIPLNSAFSEQRIINLSSPVAIGRLVDGQEATRDSLKFNSKVVSRQHARMSFQDAKVRGLLKNI